jgi:hypothetical protein
MEDNHAALSGITLPAKSGASGEKDALMEHTPAARSSKQEAASAAYRERRLARYEKVRKLHEQRMSMMAICRTLGIGRGAVRLYVQSDAFPEHRRHPPQKMIKKQMYGRASFGLLRRRRILAAWAPTG